MKTKDSKETMCVVLTMITKKIQNNIFRVEKGTDFAGEYKKLCKGDGNPIHSAISETKAVFAERKIRSLKKIIYRYMEGYAYKIQVHSQTVSIGHNPGFHKKVVDRLDTKENQEFRLFVLSIQQAITRL